MFFIKTNNTLIDKNIRLIFENISKKLTHYDNLIGLSDLVENINKIFEIYKIDKVIFPQDLKDYLGNQNQYKKNFVNSQFFSNHKINNNFNNNKIFSELNFNSTISNNNSFNDFLNLFSSKNPNNFQVGPNNMNKFCNHKNFSYNNNQKINTRNNNENYINLSNKSQISDVDEKIQYVKSLVGEIPILNNFPYSPLEKNKKYNFYDFCYETNKKNNPFSSNNSNGFLMKPFSYDHSDFNNHQNYSGLNNENFFNSNNFRNLGISPSININGNFNSINIDANVLKKSNLVNSEHESFLIKTNEVLKDKINLPENYIYSLNLNEENPKNFSEGNHKFCDENFQKNNSSENLNNLKEFNFFNKNIHENNFIDLDYNNNYIKNNLINQTNLHIKTLNNYQDHYKILNNSIINPKETNNSNFLDFCNFQNLFTSNYNSNNNRNFNSNNFNSKENLNLIGNKRNYIENNNIISKKIKDKDNNFSNDLNLDGNIFNNNLNNIDFNKINFNVNNDLICSDSIYIKKNENKLLRKNDEATIIKITILIILFMRTIF